MGSQPNLEGLQRAYQNSGRLSYTFDFENGFKVQLTEKEYQRSERFSLIGRFQDAKDMRHLLPQKVLEQIKAKPEDEKKIIGNFINESLTVFYWFHYIVSRRILGV